MPLSTPLERPHAPLETQNQSRFPCSPLTTKAPELFKESNNATDYLSRALNSLLNPFNFTDIFVPEGATKAEAGMYHAGTLAIGYGGLGYVMRKMVQSRIDQSAIKKSDKKIRSHLRARLPIMSPDENLRDAKAEAKLRGLGKTAGFNPIKDITTLPARIMEGDQHSSHLAFAVVAAIAGGATGWRLADYQEDQNTIEGQDKRIARARNLIDKYTHQEYTRTRGLGDKQAEDQDLDDINDSKSFWAGALNPASWLQAGASASWLWAVTALALSYKAGKTYYDKNDPGRKRLQELEDIAKQRALTQQSPQILGNIGTFSNIEGALKPAPSSRNVKSVALPPPQPPPTDPDDPVGKLLTP